MHKLLVPSPNQLELTLDCYSWRPANSFDKKLVDAFWHAVPYYGSEEDGGVINQYDLKLFGKLKVIKLPWGTIGNKQYVVGKCMILFSISLALIFVRNHCWHYFC